MEVIAESRAQARGVYCGTIGYFGFNGHADLNIAIRTATNDKLSHGSKVVVASLPSRNLPQSMAGTLTKISRIMEAFAP